MITVASKTRFVAVAYNVWQYVNVTGDTAFMEQYGAEMILEVAFLVK